jgi:hypothetical protein
MAAGVPLRRVIEIVGHEHSISTKEMVVTLRKLGVRVPRPRLVRLGKRKASIRHTPRRCVLLMKLENATHIWGHYVLRWDGLDYDPSDYGWIYWSGMNPRLTSYLEIG